MLAIETENCANVFKTAVRREIPAGPKLSTGIPNCLLVSLFVVFFLVYNPVPLPTNFLKPLEMVFTCSQNQQDYTDCLFYFNPSGSSSNTVRKRKLVIVATRNISLVYTTRHSLNYRPH